MPELDGRRGMPILDFWSHDRSFGLHVGEPQLWNILWLCERSGTYETGGILAGHYTDMHDRAIVAAVSGPTIDSHHGKACFYRGTCGLQRWLDQLWNTKHNYYLGEWHYHPCAPARPSLTDMRQMEAIAISSQYTCPEPVLLIIGGDVARTWEARAFICPRGNDVIELQSKLHGT